VKPLILVATLAIAVPLGAATAKRVDQPQAAPKSEPKVTLDVKDAELRDVLASMKKQCGIKNLLIDPGIGGKTGSIFVKDVPCSQAFKLVLRMSGLEAKIYPNSIVHVGVPRR
jgi:type II secretory pathway component HofQ